MTRSFWSNKNEWGKVNKGDATGLPIETESTACVVTSPPYNVGIDYNAGGFTYHDDISWDAYTKMAHKAADQMHRILVPGGRAWINVMPSVPKKSLDLKESDGARVNLQAIWMEALAISGLQYRDTVAWEQDSYDGACAWGSWLRPSAPNLRGGWEVVLLYFKDFWKREAPKGFEGWQADKIALGGEWQDLCRNVWKLRPAHSRSDAPAPFPPELPARAIRLSTWPGEVVVDPFAGSGTTVQVATELGRKGIGFDSGLR